MLKNILTYITLLVVFHASLMANEIQVFTKNTMEIPLDSKTVTEKIYMGKYEDFMKNPSANLKKGLSTAVANGTIQGAMNSSEAYKAAGKLDPNTMLAGGLGALAAYTVGSGIKWFIADNQYVYISLAINSKGVPTMIQTLIVANNFLTDSEIEEIGKKALNEQIEK